MASSGEQTMGSPRTLKEVFRRMGTPVRWPCRVSKSQ